MSAQQQLSPDFLGPPPLELARGASIFLDLDGTLIDLADRPDDIIADRALIATLDGLSDRLGGRVAIVSGRSVAQLDAIFGGNASALAMAGSHGGEYRTGGDYRAPPRPASLDLALARLRAFADGRDGVLVEDKSLGAALHYRLAPHLEADAIALACEVAADHGLVLQPGKMMAEVRVAGDKGAAIRTLMESAPFAGSRPIFFGDDVTDEDGFRAAASLSGAGVLVGPARHTDALYRVDGVAAVRAWLDEVAA